MQPTSPNPPRPAGPRVRAPLPAITFPEALPVSARREDIARCYALGANSFVVKRLTPADPGFYFTDAVRYWIQLNQTPSSAGASG